MSGLSILTRNDIIPTLTTVIRRNTLTNLNVRRRSIALSEETLIKYSSSTLTLNIRTRRFRRFPFAQYRLLSFR